MHGVAITEFAPSVSPTVAERVSGLSAFFDVYHPKLVDLFVGDSL